MSSLSQFCSYLPLLPTLFFLSLAGLLVVGGLVAGLIPHRQSRGFSASTLAEIDAQAAVLRQRGGLPG